MVIQQMPQFVKISLEIVQPNAGQEVLDNARIENVVTTQEVPLHILIAITFYQAVSVMAQLVYQAQLLVLVLVELLINVMH